MATGAQAEATGTSEWPATWRVRPYHRQWCVAHIDGGTGSWLLGHFPKKGVYRLRKTLKRGPCKRTLDSNEVPTWL